MCMQQYQFVGYHSESPKLSCLTRNALWKYGQVCWESTCKNPNQTIEKFWNLVKSVECDVRDGQLTNA